MLLAGKTSRIIDGRCLSISIKFPAVQVSLELTQINLGLFLMGKQSFCNEIMVKAWSLVLIGAI